MTEKRQEEYRCAMETALNVISGKWKLKILNQLIDGPMRYMDIKHGIGDITEKMLTQQLRELEDDHIVQRKVYPVVPPKVEYSFTTMGQELTHIFYALEVWGNSFITQTHPEAKVRRRDASCYLGKTAGEAINELTGSNV